MDIENLAQIRDKVESIQKQVEKISKWLERFEKYLIPEHWDTLKKAIKSLTNTVEILGKFCNVAGGFADLLVIFNPGSTDRRNFDTLNQQIRLLGDTIKPTLTQIAREIDSIKVGQTYIKTLIPVPTEYEYISQWADRNGWEHLDNLKNSVSLLRDKILYNIEKLNNTIQKIRDIHAALADLKSLFGDLYEARDEYASAIAEKFEKLIKKHSDDKALNEQIAKYIKDRIDGIANPLSNYLSTIETGREVSEEFHRILEGEFIRDTLAMEKIFGTDIRLNITSVIQKCKTKAKMIDEFIGNKNRFSNENYRALYKAITPRNNPDFSHPADIYAAACEYWKSQEYDYQDARRTSWAKLYGQAKAAEIYATILEVMIDSQCTHPAEYGSTDGEGSLLICLVLPPVDIWYWHDLDKISERDSDGNEQCYLKFGTKEKRSKATYVFEE